MQPRGDGDVCDERMDVRFSQHILVEECVVMKTEGCVRTVTFKNKEWVWVGRIIPITNNKTYQQKGSLEIVLEVEVNERQGGDIILKPQLNQDAKDIH